MLRMPRVPSAVGEQTVRRARQGTPHRRRRVWQQRAAAGGTSATCLLPPRPAPKPARLSHAMVLLSWLLLPLRVAAVAASAWWQGAPAVPEVGDTARNAPHAAAKAALDVAQRVPRHPLPLWCAPCAALGCWCRADPTAHTHPELRIKQEPDQMEDAACFQGNHSSGNGPHLAGMAHAGRCSKHVATGSN